MPARPPPAGRSGTDQQSFPRWKRCKSPGWRPMRAWAAQTPAFLVVLRHQVTRVCACVQRGVRIVFDNDPMRCVFSSGWKGREEADRGVFPALLEWWSVCMLKGAEKVPKLCRIKCPIVAVRPFLEPECAGERHKTWVESDMSQQFALENAWIAFTQ